MNHAALIKESFPHIRSVHVMPLAADNFKSLQQTSGSLSGSLDPYTYNASKVLSGYFKRPDNLIFTGTYTDPIKRLYYIAAGIPLIIILLLRFFLKARTHTGSCC